MPNYMLLLHAEEKAGQALPKEVMAAWMEKMHAYKQALDKAGERQVHNGPFVETRE